jgi:stearoyl-CoA desaturase (delta-9 desaturase)
MATPASVSSPDQASEKLDPVTSIPFFLIHALALTAFFLPFHWYYPVVALGLYWARMFGITGGYHRYFSHRSYKTGRGFQFFLALLGTMSAQKGVLWWAAHHRDHHKFSDQPEDIHSPKKGLWWSHVGWILCHKYDETKIERIRDFAKYPELRWLNKYHLVPPTVLGVTLFLIGGYPLLVWGLFVSTVALWHGTFTINSLSHVFGSTRYQTTDTSKNNLFLALLTMGEGWHNNHHYYMSTANQGWFWWEIDVSYYILKSLSWVGLVWDLRLPPNHIKYSHLVPAAAPVANVAAPLAPATPVVAPPAAL